ncbi:hypothetical protein PINS_up001640 [Pythium insidiosum]|nr:hypothetical protein PINS_up001640 [Pythium insidiosum]
MTSSMMRPGNFRHDMNGPRVVEITISEYLRSKRSILKKIRRRLVIVGVIISLTAVVALALGIVIQVYHGRVTKLWQEAIGLALCFIYFVYAGATLVHSFHGFYLDGHWNKLLDDGNRLIMHLRLYGLCGIITWVLALWLGYATLSAFGLVDIREIVSSSVNIIYLITLVLVCIHLTVTPNLLRTIHRKTSQADEYFGAEFMDGIKRSQRVSSRRRRNDNVTNEDEELESQEYGAAPENENDESDDGIYLEEEEPNIDYRRRMTRTPRGSARTGPSSPARNRHAFYNADGSAVVSSAASPPEATTRSPERPVRSPTPRSQPASGRSQPSSPRNDRRMAVEMDVQAAVVDGLVSQSTVTDPDQLPFASPVFLLDANRRFEAPEFWRLWKATDTTGSFSCLFRNQPRRKEVEAHLQALGFHVVSADVQDNVLQLCFYACQLGTDVFFLCEFVLIFSRRFFQATFKCSDREAASDFVARFNLQDILVVDE